MTDLVVLNGPQIGKILRVREGLSFLGRALDNEIRIDDKTISRKHLKIESVRGRHFVTDLSSRNGTFYDGKYVIPGHEVEVKEGVPLAIGMTVICLGKGAKEQIMLFLDTVSLIRDREKVEGLSKDRRSGTPLKRQDLLSRVSVTLKHSGPLKRVLEEVLRHIFHHLKRLDRGAFVLIDPQTLQAVETICKVNECSKDIIPSFSGEAVQHVLESGKPLIFSKGYSEEKSALVDTLKVQKIESVMCVPLIYGPRIVGAMYVDSLRRPDGFRKDDLLILLDIGQRVALVAETDRLATELEEVAKNLLQEEER